MIVGLSFFVLFLIPYTIILFGTQWFQQLSHYKVFRWVSTFKPLLDAYTGPIRTIIATGPVSSSSYASGYSLYSPQMLQETRPPTCWLLLSSSHLFLPTLHYSQESIRCSYSMCWNILSFLTLSLCQQQCFIPEHSMAQCILLHKYLLGSRFLVQSLLFLIMP